MQMIFQIAVNDGKKESFLRPKDVLPHELERLA